MIILSGPSTVGKNPFIYEACRLYNLDYIVPYTTRKIRSEERNGKDYFFLSKSDFQTKIKNAELDDWDYCLENYYGFSFANLDIGNQITHGLSRMALRIKKKCPNQVTIIFLMPKNKDIIFRNLKQIYSGKLLLLREELVEEEICHSTLFDEIFSCSNSVFDVLQDKKMQQILIKP